MKNIQVIKYLSLAALIFASLGLSYHFFIAPPVNFPINSVIPIKNGSVLTGISRDLKARGIIRSELALQFFATLFSSERRIIAGDYLFDRPITVWNVAYRISLGKHHQKIFKITIPEGFNVKEIAQLLSGKFLNFSQPNFIHEASPREGYLFPDTYFFYPTMTEQEIIKILSDNFQSKIAPFQAEIKKNGQNLAPLIIMASLIEKESGGPDDKALISGILWQRLEKGIRLQVDALPETYKKVGLPENPVSNPGLDSIKAAIHPVLTSYFFYLHDKKGKIHYAKTFEEHKLNKLKYLK